MFRPSSTRVGRRSPRRGAILLVVLTLLALFAVIGLAFVLYAESEANASRIARESVTNTNTTGLNAIDSTQAVNSFLGQFIYSNNDGNSALNGYDMARMIYGSAGNTVPYNGHGVYRESLNLPTLMNPAVDRTQVINFTPLRWSISASGGTETIVYVDPDRTNGNGIVRTAATPAAFLALTPPTHFVARNAAYTYPDRNNVYVAVQDPATGQIVLPSYHRPTLFGGLDASNQNWYVPEGKFKILRSRTIDNLTLDEIKYLQAAGYWPSAGSAPPRLTPPQFAQLQQILTGQDATANALPNATYPNANFKTLFPYPPANPDGTITGDVQNMKFATGATQAQNYGMQRFDSVWLDANMPTVTYRGKTLRPMVAATVLPMDGRVNLNVAGNLNGVPNGVNSTSGSHQGFGPHEINLGTVMALNPTDLNSMVTGRYGSGVVPNTRNSSNTQQYFHQDPLNPADFSKAPQYNANFQTLPPTYSQVNWNASGTNTSSVYPTPATDYRSNPNYTGSGTAYGNSDPATETSFNPVMFNPYQWDYFTKGGTSTTFTKQLPTSDERRLQARYSDNTNFLFNYSVLGSSLPTYAQTNPNNPANVARAMLTPISNRNHRPGLAPNFFGTSNSNVSVNKALGSNLTYTPGGLPTPFSYTNSDATLPSPPTLDVTAVQLVDTSFGGGDTNIVATNAQIQNVRTALSGIDLNQPLPDYRINRPLTSGQPDLTAVWPMNPTNITVLQYQIANDARQALAKAIFNRLAIATGARISVDPNTGVVTLPIVIFTPVPTYTLRTLPVSQGEYDALRWLAQLAVNIVDYIDADDISTPFVWNPDLSGAPPNPYSATEIGYRVVFGVEKPRLVINEAYGEIANDQLDMGTPSALKPFRVRFFVELLNPNNIEKTTGKMAGTDDPAIHSPIAGIDATALGSVPLVVAGNSPYRLEVYDNNLQVQTDLIQNPASLPTMQNVLGKPTIAPRLAATLSNLSTPGAANLKDRVEPNNTAFSAVPNANPTLAARNGFAVVGPVMTATTDSVAFVPNPATADLYKLMLNKPAVDTTTVPTPNNADQLEYLVKKEQAPVLVPATFPVLNPAPTGKQAHAILLRRLACPYLRLNDPQEATPAYNAAEPYNPYITVDYITQVKVNDAIKVAETNGVSGNRNPNTPQPQNNWSVGRVQPMAGYQNPDPALTANYLDPTIAAPINYSQSLVVGQIPLNKIETNTPQKVTFFRMNSSQSPTITSTIVSPTPLQLYDATNGNSVGNNTKAETLLAPFEWLTHLDRKLISPAELLSVGARRPYELTHNFAVRGTVSTATELVPRPLYHQHTLAKAALIPGTNPLYRIMEMLQPKPWTYGIAAGSRIPGGININMLWEQDATTLRSKVFDALMDKQLVNDFTNTGANNDLTTIWDGLKATRSPSWTGVPPVVGITKDELDASTNAAGFDSPFKGLGVANFIVNAGVLSQTDVNSTILRIRPSDNKTLFSRYTSATPPAVTPGSYADLEPLRKAYNNITTVSDTYMVVFTIGYFETDTTGYPGKELLRREAFNQVPGDLRSQFSAIIDRSALGYDTSGSGSTGRPWFTEVATEVTKASPSGTTTNPSPVNPLGTNTRFYFRFNATGINATSDTIFVNYEGQTISIQRNNSIRIGVGLSGLTGKVSGFGFSDPTPIAPYVPVAPPLPAFDPNTGLATITVDVPTASLTANGPPQFSPGSAMSGVVIPGNPGAQPGFDYTQFQYKSVVRDFGMLRPNP